MFPLFLPENNWFLCCRKFIEMGFIDKDRIAIWGWVSCSLSCCSLYFLNKPIFPFNIFAFTKFNQFWPSVIRWLCHINGLGCWNWTLQVWNSSCSSSQVGILWLVCTHTIVFLTACSESTVFLLSFFQNSQNSHWSHKRLYPTFFTDAVGLLRTCEQTLMCRLWVPL